VCALTEGVIGCAEQTKPVLGGEITSITSVRTAGGIDGRIERKLVGGVLLVTI
jgi:hypothetical protein